MARVQGIIPPLIFLSCPRVFDYQPPVAKISGVMGVVTTLCVNLSNILFPLAFI